MTLRKNLSGYFKLLVSGAVDFFDSKYQLLVL
jgi:hypothetical protein